MGKNPTDRMRDPFYAGLLFQIEHIICQADDEAKSKGIRLTDSQIKSALNKTRGKLEGGTPVIPTGSEKDKIIAQLIDSLCLAHHDLAERQQYPDGTETDKPLDVMDWIRAIETVEDSVKTRKSHIPGSRDYLDFVHGFIEQAKGRT